MAKRSGPRFLSIKGSLVYMIMVIIIIIMFVIIIIIKTWLLVDMELFSLNIRRGNPYLCLRMYYSLCKELQTL